MFIKSLLEMVICVYLHFGPFSLIKSPNVSFLTGLLFKYSSHVITEGPYKNRDCGDTYNFLFG